MNITYRLMTIDDYREAYDLWILCGNGLNDKDDSREGIEKYLKRNPTTSFVCHKPPVTLEPDLIKAIECTFRQK